MWSHMKCLPSEVTYRQPVKYDKNVCNVVSGDIIRMGPGYESEGDKSWQWRMEDMPEEKKYVIAEAGGKEEKRKREEGPV